MYSTDVSRTDADAKGILLLEGAAGPKDAILAFLETTPGAELQEIAQAIAEEPSKVSVHLSQLKQRGRVNNNLRKWALASNRETET